MTAKYAIKMTFASSFESALAMAKTDSATDKLLKEFFTGPRSFTIYEREDGKHEDIKGKMTYFYYEKVGNSHRVQIQTWIHDANLFIWLPINVGDSGLQKCKEVVFQRGYGGTKGQCHIVRSGDGTAKISGLNAEKKAFEFTCKDNTEIATRMSDNFGYTQAVNKVLLQVMEPGVVVADFLLDGARPVSSNFLKFQENLFNARFPDE